MSPKNHSVDVVLCTANRDRNGLLRSLQSLRESTCSDVRVLLVNDSADPLTADLNTSGMNISVVNLGANFGLTHALKATEVLLAAPLVARMDCGDTMSPYRLEKQRDFLLHNPKYALVGTRSEFIIRSSDQVQRIGYSASSAEIPEIRNYLLWRNPFVHGSIMYRRDDFLAIGGYDSRFKIAQDFNLYMRMRTRGELYILPEVLYTHNFNINGSNTVKKNKASVASSLRSRLTLSTVKERLNPLLLAALLRDLLILLLPASALAWLKFGRHLKR